MKKINKQREYATMLRAQHSASRKPWARKGAASVPVKANHVIEAEKKREAVSITTEQVTIYSKAS